MAYLGKQPALQSNEFREEFNITSTTSTIATSGFVVSGKSNYLDVYKNGVLLGSDDYTLGADRKTITLASNAIAGDIIVVIGRRNLTQGVRFSERRHEHTIANNETTVTFPYPLTGDSTDVYLNGVKLASSDFSINVSTKVISFTVNPVNGDVIAIVSREPATSSSTVLPIVDSNGGSVISESNGSVVVNAGTANIGSNALVVDASGNVGIGKSSPNVKLDVYGSIDLSASTTETRAIEVGRRRTDNGYAFIDFIGDATYTDFGLRIIRNNTGPNAISEIRHRGTGNLQISTAEAAAIQLSTNNTERMRIDSNGHWALNRFESTQGASSGVNGAFYNNSSGYLVLGNGGDVACIMNRWTSQGNIVQYRYNGSVVGSISTNTNSLPSDRDFKKDINDLNLGLELVKKLKPKSYRYNIDDDNSPFMTGLIAQDLEESLAEVGVAQNESWILQYNENVEEGNSKYELDYSKLIPVLTKAIQEQQTIIESQQSQIDALTARIEALEAGN